MRVVNFMMLCYVILIIHIDKNELNWRKDKVKKEIQTGKQNGGKEI